MLVDSIESINNQIKKKRKAIVAIGCSFVEGMGALDPLIYMRYHWHRDPVHGTIINLAGAELTEFLNRYPDITKNPNGSLNFKKMQHKNAFANVLCKKYFDDEYVCINLGLGGRGSRASIKELYCYPIDWSSLDKIIVIYLPTGQSRFDFVNDEWDTTHDQNHWFTIMPGDTEESGPKGNLSRSYLEGIWSNKFEILEQVLNAKELETWCKLHNASLIITPAFEIINKDFYINNVLKMVVRDTLRNAGIEEVVPDKSAKYMVETYPWDSMFYPEGSNSFAHLTIAKEGASEPTHLGNYADTGSPNGWVTPCSHPSAIAHDYFAKLLREEIIKRFT